MIDFALELKSIKHMNLKNMDFGSYGFNENIKKSIIIYNKAIAEIKADELDLAIKDLKTSLSYNSGFAEAIKVLGLCYASKKDYRRAKKTFKKLSKYEMYSEVANQYIENILTEKNITKTLNAIKNAKDSVENKKPKKLKRRIIIATTFLAAVITGFFVIYKYSSTIQAYTNIKKNNEVSKNNKGKDENLENSKSSATVSLEEYKNIEKKLNDTQSELDNYKKKNDIAAIFKEVQKHYNNEDYEKAARGLLDVKDKNLDKETKIKVDDMLSNIKTKHIWTVYNDANKLYKEGKYAEAMPKLKVVSEIDSDLDITPWITYQIGVCYKEGKDNANALTYFKKVKEKYPKSDYVQYSQLMIDEIAHK